MAKQNLSISEPSLNDLLQLLKKDILLSLVCHHIGTVQSFNSANQTATATINYKITEFRIDETTGQNVPFLRDYPLLIDCPVVVLGGDQSSLTFPIAPGDECLILFNDRDIDNWFAGSSSSGVATPRLHSFADGLILVGLHSLNTSLSNYDGVRAVLQNAQAMVGVGPSLIKIANNITTLNTLLQSLITNIENLVTATSAITVTGVTSGGAVSGPPANAAAILAVNTALGTLATQFGELLE